MKKFFLVVLCLFSALAFCQEPLKVGVDYSGRLIVKPKAGQAPALLFESGRSLDSRLSAMGLYLVPVPKGVDPLEYGEKLMGTGAFEYVHPDYVCHPAALPNDPLLLSQWHLFQISAPRAWDATAGNANVVIAITDTGVDLTHPDLQNRVSGYNAASHQEEASGGFVNDVHSTGHGTRVTGLACATGNNGIGIAGVAYSCPFMPIRVSNAANGTAVMADILEGIQWAVDHGARVVNTSYDNEQVAAVETAGEYCWNHGAFSVWAAGNQGVDTKNLNAGVEWDHKRVVIVGATDQQDAKASFSNYGKALDVFAPGMQVLTTNKGGGYGNVSGTSFASPIVAGSLALILAQNPGLDLDNAQMRLFRCCRDLGVDVQPDDPAYKPGNDLYWGWGRISTGTTLLNERYRYHLTILPPLPGYSGDQAFGINNKGEVVGTSIASVGRATIWSSSGVPTGIGTFPYPAWPGYTSDAAFDISDTEKILLDAWPGPWVFTYDNGNMQAVPNWQGRAAWAYAEDINNSGEVVGTYGPTTGGYWGFKWTADGITRLYSGGPLMGGAFGYSINNFGTAVGVTGADEYGGWHGFFDDTLNMYRLIEYGGTRSAAYTKGVNDSNYAVGFCGNPSAPTSVLWDLDNSSFNRVYNWGWALQACRINNWNEVIGIEAYSGRPFVIDGYNIGFIDTMLDAPLPNNWANFNIWAINEKHTMVGCATLISGAQQAFRLDPLEGIGVTVDLGQLGSNPSYIGALPPAFVVDFKDEQGNQYVGSRRSYSYDSLTGRAQVVVPPEVTGPFRAYFRLTNAADNPDYAAGNWQGPGYLGMVYPPLNLPALPIDASYIPPIDLYQGDSDSDNEITIADYSILSKAFGTFIGDPDWDARADIDGDEEISQGDLDKIIENFGLVGD